MSAASFLTIMAALAVVLGTMSIALRFLRRYTAAGAAKGGVKMEIMQRVTLGQKQGLAVVRVGARVLVVSMGEGGVHPVAELTEGEIATAEPKTADSATLNPIADGLRKLSLIRGGASAESKVEVPAKRISYVAPMEDFQAVLSMAMAGGAR